MSNNNNEEWDGVFHKLLISSDHDKELFNEIKSLSARSRSSRLRMLALVGLYAINNNNSKFSGTEPVAVAEPVTEPVAVAEPVTEPVTEPVATQSAKDRLRKMASDTA